MKNGAELVLRWFGWKQRGVVDVGAGCGDMVSRKTKRCGRREQIGEEEEGKGVALDC